jgi:hypothetical protein
MPEYRITTGLPQIPTTNDEKSFALVLPIYQAMNAVSKAVSQADGQVEFSQVELAQRNQLASINTQNHRKLYALATTTLAYGKLVNLFVSGGKIAAQYADCNPVAKPAHGIVNNPFGINASEYGEIMLVEGYTQGIAGTTLGSYYYLSTNGDAALARPVGAGKIIQACGFGLGSAGFYLHISSFFQQL